MPSKKDILTELIAELNSIETMKIDLTEERKRTDTARYELTGLRAQLRRAQDKCNALERHYKDHLITPADVLLLSHHNAEIKWTTRLNGLTKVEIKAHGRTIARIRLEDGDTQAAVLERAIATCRDRLSVEA